MYKKVFWTHHAQMKLRQYGLSKQKLLGIIRKPDRAEQGIAPGTTAVMQTNKKYNAKRVSQNVTRYTLRASRPVGEIWLMYKDAKGMRTIISAWRYPGISKPGESIPIPEEIKRELAEG